MYDRTLTVNGFSKVLVYNSNINSRALRGLVRLKTLIQGQSVKRQATTTLRCMQTLARVQSQIRTRRLIMSEETQVLQRQLLQKHEKEADRLRSSSGEDWNDSAQSKEQVDANLQHKQEAAIRRERALAYAYTHMRFPCTSIQRAWEVNNEEQLIPKNSKIEGLLEAEVIAERGEMRFPCTKELRSRPLSRRKQSIFSFSKCW